MMEKCTESGIDTVNGRFAGDEIREEKGIKLCGELRTM
jgi:hypothetical protein